jgi:putative transposase
MSETELRKEAIRRYMMGESKSSIGRELGKSRQWVGQWVERYDPDQAEASLQDRSHAPINSRQEWPGKVMEMALSMRRQRIEHKEPGYQHALIGAEAIHYEMEALGIRPTPPVRTIHFWLKRAGLVDEPHPQDAREKEPKPYPTPKREAVNDLHQFDLKGPLYLTDSSQKHYLLASRDYASKRITLDISQDKRSKTMAGFLVKAWQQRGLPTLLQMDNAMELRGSNRYPRSFSLVVRLCLDVGVEPLFVPPHEPWRNGFIENFNGLADRLLLKRETFADFHHFRQAAQRLQDAINSSHRLAALDGKTPNEFKADSLIRFLSPDYDGLKRNLKLLKGSISFIRLVRKSGRITTFASDKFDIDTDLQWQYVLARVDIPAQTLNIFHQATLIKSFDYPLPL